MKLCIIPQTLKLREIDQRSFLLNFALKAYYVPLCGVTAKALNSNCKFTAILVPEAKCVKYFLLSKAMTTAAAVGFNGSFRPSAISLFVLNCQRSGSDKKSGGHKVAAERHRKGQVTADGETGVIGRAVVSDEWSDNRNSTDKLCGNCNNMS